MQLVRAILCGAIVVVVIAVMVAILVRASKKRAVVQQTVGDPQPEASPLATESVVASPDAPEQPRGKSRDERAWEGLKFVLLTKADAQYNSRDGGRYTIYSTSECVVITRWSKGQESTAVRFICDLKEAMVLASDPTDRTPELMTNTDRTGLRELKWAGIRFLAGSIEAAYIVGTLDEARG